MPLYYLDTSALVKLYVLEPGTEAMLELAAGPDTSGLALLALARPEFYSAVRRRERSGDIDPPAATGLLAAFESHLSSRFVRQSVNDAVMDMACALIDRHTLRVYDALQLAGCLVMSAAVAGALVFVCADRELAHAAEIEGLPALNPAA